MRLGGLTYREIAQFTGLSPYTVKNSGFLDALLAQQRIHIAQWKRSRNGPMSAVYLAGPGRNADKPAALNAAEKSRRHRTRCAASGEGAELIAQLAGLLRSADRLG